MRKAGRVTVVFACPHCAAAYVATQRRIADIGSFDCWECKTEIYRWSGEYQYLDWEQIDVVCAKQGKSG